MSDTEGVTITLALPDHLALALAQFCKRVGFSDCRNTSADQLEAYEQMDALACVRKALADVGYSPR